jgi:hypothetical protein
MKLPELDNFQNLKDFVLKNRVVDAAKIGQTNQMTDLEKSESLLELERKQLVCLISLVEVVNQKHQQMSNLLVGTTFLTWVLVLITFIAVISN